MAAVDLPAPGRGSGTAPDPAGPVAVGGFSLRVFDAGPRLLRGRGVRGPAAVRRTSAGGRCRPGRTALRFGISAGPGDGPGVNVLVVAGTVTDKLAPLVLAAYRDLPEPRRVLSFGACSNSGGPYWDSYCVTKGADQIIPVDVYVPGCPPRPEALVHGLLLLRDAGGEQR